jgi:hypothetical protein
MLKNERGAALLLTVLAMFLILALGMTLLETGATEANIASNQIRSVQAFYAAEAGIEETLVHLKDNPSYDPPDTPVTVGIVGPGNLEAKYQITLFSKSGETVQIESTGMVGNSKYTLTAQGTVKQGGGYLSRGLTAFAVSSNTLSIIVKEDSLIGPYMFNHPHRIKHTTYPPHNQDNSIGFPELPTDWYKPAGLGSPYVINGTVFDLNVFKTGYPYYKVNGDIYLRHGNLSLNGTIIEATGQVYLENGTFKGFTMAANQGITVNSNTDLENLVLTGKNIILNSNTDADNLFIYNTGYTIINSNVDFTGILITKNSLVVNSNVEIEGSVVCSSLIVNSNATITYKEDIAVPIVPAEISEIVVSLDSWGYKYTL